MTTFNWKYGYAHYVELWGSFNDWNFPYFMEDGTVTIDLEPGTYEYKFKVDGNWCYDIVKPVAKKHMNNIKVVEGKDIVTIVHISDTHSLYHDVLPDGDIFVHTGDFSIGGHYREYEIFNEWVKKFDFKHKLLVLGNHDLDYFTDNGKDPHIEANKILTNVNILYDHKNIMGIDFYGKSWNYNHMWNYECKIPHSADNYYNIHGPVDILLTHGPAFGNYGSKQLLERINIVKPKLHLFGHIHYQYGICHNNGTYFCNGSSVTEDSSKIVNKPIVIKFDSKNKVVMSAS